jgi:uncharacterized membrane protein YkvA (DUF1232 family)
MRNKLKNEWVTPERRHLGWWRQALEQLRFAWILMTDSRMPVLYKLIPLVTLAYIISPIDIIPDVFVGLGVLDDIGVFMLGISWFNSLAPSELALDHLRRLNGETDKEVTIKAEPLKNDLTEDETISQNSQRSASRQNRTG